MTFHPGDRVLTPGREKATVIRHGDCDWERHIGTPCPNHPHCVTVHTDGTHMTTNYPAAQLQLEAHPRKAS